MRAIFDNLRIRLLLLVLLAAIPALGLTYWSGLEQRRLARENAVAEAAQLTRLVAEYHATLIDGARSLLQILASNPALLDTGNCAQVLGEAQSKYPVYNNISLVQPDGLFACSSIELDQPVKVADRDDFQAILAGADFAIGHPTTSRATGRMVIPLAAPIRAQDGSLHRVLIAALDLNEVLRFAQHLELPTQSAVLMVDRQGTVITRFPDTELWTGRNLPQVQIIKHILQAGGAGSAETAGVDGVLRLYAFTPLEFSNDDGLFISVGIPSAVAYASANRLMRTNLIWLGIAALAALTVAWYAGDALILRIVSLTAERDQAERELRLANASLEERVAQRTQELAQANLQLESELIERQQMVQILRERKVELDNLLQQLQRSNRDLQDFAYIASHDLQEPLRKIQAFSERLMQRYQPALGEEGQDFLQRMDSSARRMQAMINALLTYSRISTKGQQFVPTDLSAVLKDVLSDLELRVHELQAVVSSGPLPVIEADPLQMRQLFQNLIANALKFHRAGVPPRVEISATRDADSASIEIRDNGIGFDEKYAGRIFQPFQRLHGRDAYEGSGIGLAICRKIVERHNGQIVVTSVPDQGSCFRITLPLRQPDQKEKQPHESTGVAG